MTSYQALVVGLLLLAATEGKSALVPFSGWLPRAMEGPTPSSAVFYGAPSVHLGAFLLIKPIVAPIRATWSQVKMVIRVESGFCHDEIRHWGAENGVDSIIGLAKTPKLVAAESDQARQQFEATKQPAPVFAELRYQTRQTWGRERRVVAKADGGVRIVSGPLPIKAPWLNRIEPQWVHGKRAIVDPDRPLKAAEVVERVCGYYGCEQLERLSQQVA